MTWERGRALIRVRPGGGNWPLFVLALATVGCTVAVSTPPPHEYGAGVSSRTGIRRTVRLGTSVRGRPVTAIEIGEPGSRFTVLVVGWLNQDGAESAGLGFCNAWAKATEGCRTGQAAMRSANSTRVNNPSTSSCRFIRRSGGRGNAAHTRQGRLGGVAWRLVRQGRRQEEGERASGPPGSADRGAGSCKTPIQRLSFSTVNKQRSR